MNVDCKKCVATQKNELVLGSFETIWKHLFVDKQTNVGKNQELVRRKLKNYVSKWSENSSVFAFRQTKNTSKWMRVTRKTCTYFNEIDCKGDPWSPCLWQLVANHQNHGGSWTSTCHPLKPPRPKDQIQPQNGQLAVPLLSAGNFSQCCFVYGVREKYIIKKLKIKMVNWNSRKQLISI